MDQLGGVAKTLQVVTNWCNTTTMNYFRHDILCVAAEINLLCVGAVSNLLCVLLKLICCACVLLKLIFCACVL